MADKTPDMYVKLFNGTYQGTGQCVAGFQHFCNWLGYPTIRTGNNCAWNYGVSDAKSREIQQYFNRIDSIGKMQDGDWYISRGPSQYGHVAMYYHGESFGQNQVGSGGGYKYTSKPFSWWSSSFICAYRAKVWCNASFSGTGGKSSGFRTYQLSESQLRGIADLCEREQGSAAGAASEASLLANMFELWGAKKGQKTIWDTANSSWFAARSRIGLTAQNPSTDVYNAVKDVLVNGNRRLPNYIDEHDYIGDIAGISTGDYHNASNFVQDRTVIRNTMGSTYTFYCWGDESRIKNGRWGGITDPFGYTMHAKNQAKSLGLDGTVGGGTVGGDAGGYVSLYSTSNDRNDATLRESAYMDVNGTQTLSNTNIPLSVINYTPAVANMYGTVASGESSGEFSNIPVSTLSMKGKVNSAKIDNSVAKEIFDILINMGGSPAFACGMLGNIYQECRYDSSVIEGGSGAGAGLIQWTGPRRSRILEKYLPSWRTAGIAAQVDIMMKEIFGTIGADVNGKNRFKDTINLWNGQITTTGGAGTSSWLSAHGLKSKIIEGPLTNSEEGAMQACYIILANHEQPGTPATSTRVNETRKRWQQLQFIV